MTEIKLKHESIAEAWDAFVLCVTCEGESSYCGFCGTSHVNYAVEAAMKMEGVLGPVRPITHLEWGYVPLDHVGYLLNEYELERV